MTVAVLALAGAGAGRSAWGPPVEVPVAAADLPAGAVVDADALRWERRPADLVPADVVTAAEADAAPVLAATVVAGTVLTRRHLAGDGGLAAGLLAGRAAFPVEVGPLVRVTPGQAVDVVAGDVDGQGRTLARDARVISVVDGVVWLDIGRDDAPALAAAATWDGLRLVLLPGPGG